MSGARDPAAITIPYTVGMWQNAQPVEVTLAQGKNALNVVNAARGFALKDITLTPAE